MARKTILLLACLLIIASCSKQPGDVVVYHPKNPKAGDKVVILFTPQRLTSLEQQISIRMIYQVFNNNEVRTFRVPMVHKKNLWKAEVSIEQGDYLLCVKFEDNIDRVEDNNGYGWNLMLKDEQGNVQRNTYYKLGSILNQKERAIPIPNYKKAVQQFKQELLLFSDNYQVWFDLWYSRLKMSDKPQDKLKTVSTKLDSLLSACSPNAELLTLAYNTNLKMLSKPEQALKNGEQILANYKDYPQKDKIAHSMIIQKNRTNPEILVSELTNFSNQTKNREYKKKAYYQLGSIFQQLRQMDQSIYNFQRYIEMAPNNIPVRLTLANYYLRKKEYARSREMINQALKNNTEEIYFKENPWERPVQRSSQLNLSQCQILSTQASLDFEIKNYQHAIQNRKKCIELATPFPAFEWAKIGDVYFHIDKFDSAQQAYTKAVSINATQQDAIDKLKLIYLKSGNSLTHFDSFLQEAIKQELKSSAKLAPDFELFDLQDNKLKLSQQRGKIVLLTFWDSWSAACKQEIPQLNALVDDFKNSPQILFWAISVEAPVSINKFIREHPFSYLQLHSGYEAKKMFNIIGFPTHVVIDAEGKIRFTQIGYSQDIHIQLKNKINSLLKETNSVF